MHINRIPKSTPSLLEMMNDLCASKKDVAKAMRVHESTVDKWIKNKAAPWSVCVALYWNTRHGHSVISADATNRTQELVNRYQSEREINRDLLAKIDKLEAENTILRARIHPESTYSLNNTRKNASNLHTFKFANSGF